MFIQFGLSIAILILVVLFLYSQSGEVNNQDYPNTYIAGQILIVLGLASIAVVGLWIL